LAVSPALWFFPDGVSWCCSAVSVVLVEFRLPPESYSDQPSRPAAARQLLSWALLPFSTFRNRRSTFHGSRPTRYGSSSGFGYPLDDFRPSIPGRFCFAPAALLGFTLRSSALTRYPGLSTRMSPPAVSPCRRSRCLTAAGRFGRLRLLGFDPGERSRRRLVGLAPPPRATPLGFAPSRVDQRRPRPGFPPASSHALGWIGRERPRLPAPQSVNQSLPSSSAFDHFPRSKLRGRIGRSKDEQPS